MKGLILCAGLGSRLWPITHTLPKHLIPLAGRPILFYIIDLLADININEIGIVVGENQRSFQEALNKYDNKNVSFHFIKQEKPLGIANALLEAKEFINDDEFIMVLGDNLYHPSIKDSIQHMINSQYNSHVLIKEVEEPQRYGIVKIEKDRVVDVIEKPDNPPSNLALAGIYTFDSNIFIACENIRPSKRNEYELTDAMKWLIDHGYTVSYEKLSCLWEDLGKPEDILRANQFLLSDIQSNNEGSTDEVTKLEGKVVIGKNSIIKNSIIKGPVMIGDDSIIEDAYIGPNTSIYNHTEIVNSQIQNSIILEGCIISDLQGTIDASILERNCIIKGMEMERMVKDEDVENVENIDKNIEKGEEENKVKQEGSSGKVIHLLLGKNSRIMINN